MKLTKRQYELITDLLGTFEWHDGAWEELYEAYMTTEPWPTNYVRMDRWEEDIDHEMDVKEEEMEQLGEQVIEEIEKQLNGTS